jgi:hypothetical protein
MPRSWQKVSMVAVMAAVAIGGAAVPASAKPGPVPAVQVKVCNSLWTADHYGIDKQFFITGANQYGANTKSPVFFLNGDGPECTVVNWGWWKIGSDITLNYRNGGWSQNFTGSFSTINCHVPADARKGDKPTCYV